MMGYRKFKSQNPLMLWFLTKLQDFRLLAIYLNPLWFDDIPACQYMKFGQSACMFCISHGIQCRPHRRYIAVTWNSILKNGMDDILNFYGL